MGQMIRDLSPGRGWEFFSSPPCPDQLWGGGHPTSYPTGTRGTFLGSKVVRV